MEFTYHTDENSLKALRKNQKEDEDILYFKSLPLAIRCFGYVYVLVAGSINYCFFKYLEYHNFIPETLITSLIFLVHYGIMLNFFSRGLKKLNRNYLN
jgi:hypothetical protein